MVRNLWKPLDCRRIYQHCPKVEKAYGQWLENLLEDFVSRICRPLPLFSYLFGALLASLAMSKWTKTKIVRWDLLH